MRGGVKPPFVQMSPRLLQPSSETSPACSSDVARRRNVTPARAGSERAARRDRFRVRRWCPGRRRDRARRARPAGRRRRSARQSESTIASRSAAGSRASSRGRGAQRQREVGAALAAQREQVVDERRGRARLALAPAGRARPRRTRSRSSLARSLRVSTTAAVAIAASPTAWPRIEPLWSTSRHSARRGAVQRRATSSSAWRGLPARNLKGQVEVEVALARRRGSASSRR